MDFTLRAYEGILKAIKEAGIPVYTIEKWLNNPAKKGIVLRHDVDRLPKNALRMAKLESKYNIQATYYFRIGRHTFKPRIIQEIARMGHEIGYHYEDLSLAKGNFKKAFSLFEKNLKRLREHAEIRTIAMHGRPLSGIDNRDLWITGDYTDFDLIGEAFLSIDYKGFYYFTDTGRSWSDSAVNLRDKVIGAENGRVSNSFELANFITSSNNAWIAIVAHPERWNDSVFRWVVYLVLDLVVIFLKQILRRVRK